MNKIEFIDQVKKYGDMVIRVAVSSGVSYQDAEDIAQNTFLKLYEHKQQFMSEDHLKAWLLRVTINGCYDVKESRIVIHEQFYQKIFRARYLARARKSISKHFSPRFLGPIE